MTTIRAAVAALVTSASVAALTGAAAPPAAGPAPVSAGAPWPGGTVRTVGKLVARMANGDGEICSGAIVDTPNGSVVATAAHCVRNPEGNQRAVAVYFRPGYDREGGAESVVRDGWRATSWHTAPGWRTDRPLKKVLPHDWAFLTFGKRNGRTLEETYGANKLAFEPVPGGRTAALGYPVTSPYDGESLRYCAGNAHLYRSGEIADANVGALALTPCDLTQGVSGGPWLRDYDAARQAGTVVAVTSVGGEGELLGRPYPAAAKSLLRRVGG